MVPLTPLESDVLGEMAGDAHLVGEVIGFVRSELPFPDDFVVFRETYALLETWIDRGWLRLGDSSPRCDGVSTIRDLLPYLDRHGASIVTAESEVALPEIDLTDKAFADVEWLRGAV